MPLHVIRQHAEEHVRTHAFLEVMVDGPDLEIHTLQAAKRALDVGQLFIVAYRLLAGSRCGWHGRANYIDPIQRGFPFDARRVAFISDSVASDAIVKMLGHLIMS